MSDKVEVNVVIGGKIIPVTGYEDVDYIQRVAAYVGGKLNEVSAMEGYAVLDTDKRSILLALNIADEFYKEKEKHVEYEKQMDKMKEAEFALKHDLVSEQIKLETANKEIERLKEMNTELEKTIIRLETELGEQKKQTQTQAPANTNDRKKQSKQMTFSKDELK